MGMPALSPDDASTLCLSCGLCCDGTLFDRAKAEPDERERLTDSGLTVFADSQGDKFRLPCPHLSGCACTIYARRFTICRSFQCKLLQGVNESVIGIEPALETVARAKQLVQQVAAADPGLTQLSRRREEIRQGPPAGDAGRGKTFLEMLALDRFLDRHFRKKPIDQGFEALERK
jgi:uncharacterized protein